MRLWSEHLKEYNSDTEIKKKPWKFKVSFMRLVGLEPTRYRYRQILSLVRLPVPPQPRIKLLDYNII